MSLRRVYETTFIVNAALEDLDIDNVVNKVSGYIENHGGKVTTSDKWGRRRLAYPINKKFNGFYVHLVFEANPNTIPILGRFLILEDTVLRHLTLVLPQRLIDFREKRKLERGIEPGFRNDSKHSDKKKFGGPRAKREYNKIVPKFVKPEVKSEKDSDEKVEEKPETE